MRHRLTRLVVNGMVGSCWRVKKDVTDKGELFERIGRKTTGLLNGGMVTEVISRVGIAHSFEGKNGFFYWVIWRITRIATKEKEVGKEFQKILSRRVYNGSSVRNYYAGWSPTRQYGYVIIYWDGGSKAFPESSFSNLTEFQIAVGLLRNEKPVWWDGPTQRLFASYEPVGE